MITDKEVKSFWNKWDLIIVSWNLVSIIFVASLLPWILIVRLIFDIELPSWVWFYYLLIPLSFLFKYVFGFTIWFFNDTVDGDFGDPKLLKKYGHTNKPKWFKFIWWWFRNHSWNYITRFKPTCNSSKSQVSEYRIFHDSRGTGNTEWLEEEGFFYICYRCAKTNKVYCRYSKITNSSEKHFGAGGDRYKMHYKP